MSCSQVLQTVNLDVDTTDNILRKSLIFEKTLTLTEAITKKLKPYVRLVVEPEWVLTLRLSQKLKQSNQIFQIHPPKDYLVGIGVLIFSIN